MKEVKNFCNGSLNIFAFHVLKTEFGSLDFHGCRHTLIVFYCVNRSIFDFKLYGWAFTSSGLMKSKFSNTGVLSLFRKFRVIYFSN